MCFSNFFSTQPKEIFDEAKVANQAALDDAAAICGSRRISDDDRVDVLEARRVRQLCWKSFRPKVMTSRIQFVENLGITILLAICRK